MSKLFAGTMALGAFWTVLGIVVLSSSNAHAFWPGIGMAVGGALIVGCVVGALEEQRLARTPK